MKRKGRRVGARIQKKKRNEREEMVHAFKSRGTSGKKKKKKKKNDPVRTRASISYAVIITVKQ